MDHTKKEPEAIADAQSEAEIELIPDGPKKWKLTLAGPQGLEIRPGDVICIDNALLGELKSLNGNPIPVKFEAEKSSMKKRAAKAK
jgi:uncharacterized heparinase superfamily protein